MTSRHALFTVDGFTQASSVIPVVSCKDALLGTVTRALLPLKDSAPPYLPPVIRLAVPMDPLFPYDDESNAVLPAVSLNEYAATSSGIVVPVVTLTMFEGSPMFAAASVARTK